MVRRIQILTHEHETFVKFTLVGALGTLLDFSILAGLKLLGWPTLAANSLSFSAGLLNNYTLNRRWTFPEQAGDWGQQLAQFAAVSLVGLALNNAILLSMEGVLSAWAATPLWATLASKACATGIVLFWNYFANRTWTFRQQTPSMR